MTPFDQNPNVVRESRRPENLLNLEPRPRYSGLTEKGDHEGNETESTVLTGLNTLVTQVSILPRT